MNRPAKGRGNKIYLTGAEWQLGGLPTPPHYDPAKYGEEVVVPVPILAREADVTRAQIIIAETYDNASDMLEQLIVGGAPLSMIAVARERVNKIDDLCERLGEIAGFGIQYPQVDQRAS